MEAFVQIQTLETFDFFAMSSLLVKVLIIDEVDTETYSKHLSPETKLSKLLHPLTAGICWFSSVTLYGELSLRYPRSVSFVSLSTIFRNASHIANTVSFNSDITGAVERTTYCSVFGSEQTSIPATIFQDVSEILLPQPVNSCKTAIFANVDISQLQGFSQSWQVIDISEYLTNSGMTADDYHFTGMEYDVVIVVIDKTNLVSWEKVHILMNCIISRAIFEAHVYVHQAISSEIVPYVANIMEPNIYGCISQARFGVNNNSTIERILSLLHYSNYLELKRCVLWRNPENILKMILNLNIQLLFDLRSLYWSMPYRWRNDLIELFPSIIAEHHVLDPIISFIMFEVGTPVTSYLNEIDESEIDTSFLILGRCDVSELQTCLDFVCSYWEIFGLFSNTEGTDQVLHKTLLRQLLCIRDRTNFGELIRQKGPILSSEEYAVPLLLHLINNIDLAELVLEQHSDPLQVLRSVDENLDCLFHLVITFSTYSERNVVQFLKFLHERESALCPPGDSPRLHVQPDNEGCTPLRFAMEINRAEVVRYLLHDLKCELFDAGIISIALLHASAEVTNVIRDHIISTETLEDLQFLDFVLLLREPFRKLLRGEIKPIVVLMYHIWRGITSLQYQEEILGLSSYYAQVIQQTSVLRSFLLRILVHVVHFSVVSSTRILVMLIRVMQVMLRMMRSRSGLI